MRYSLVGSTLLTLCGAFDRPPAQMTDVLVFGSMATVADCPVRSYELTLARCRDGEVVCGVFRTAVNERAGRIVRRTV